MCHLKLRLFSLLVFTVAAVAGTVSSDDVHGSKSGLNNKDDLIAISNNLPNSSRAELQASIVPERISCTHLQDNFKLFRLQLALALYPHTVTTTTKSTPLATVTQGSQTFRVDSSALFNNNSLANLTIAAPPTVRFENLKMVDTFAAPSTGKSKFEIEVHHGWADLRLPEETSPKSTFSYHNLEFRIANTSKVIAVWKGQVFVSYGEGRYLSHWQGSSINLDDPRYVINVTWNLHWEKNQSCWFGDSVSFEQLHNRNSTRWTHLIEYPGNGRCSGFVVIKNLMEKSTPTQFWAGNGNTTVDVLDKANWKDYTHIWLGTEEDQSNASKHLSRGWIWTMLTAVFALCVFLSTLVFWLTRERVDYKGRRRASWMTILARSKSPLRRNNPGSRSTPAATTATTSTSV